MTLRWRPSVVVLWYNTVLGSDEWSKSLMKVHSWRSVAIGLAIAMGAVAFDVAVNTGLGVA